MDEALKKGAETSILKAMGNRLNKFNIRYLEIGLLKVPNILIGMYNGLYAYE